ncbi:MAG: enolase C-terminal domain-like protein [Geminicoccaceae bacterium]
MRIVEIREAPVRLQADIQNAYVSFADHDVSLVAVITDVVQDGKPLVGLGFNSIGRYAQGGLMRERFIRRLLDAEPKSLLDDEGRLFRPEAVLKTLMRNEKPGGHGDRAGAVAAIEIACWDVNAKRRGVPAHRTIAEHFGRPVAENASVPVYAAGGYYYPDDSLQRLTDEMKRYADQGYIFFKMKIGGADLATDLKRIEAAVAGVPAPGTLAVDANGRFDLRTALAYGSAMAPFGLRWYEEAGDPLDYALNSELAASYAPPLATGENLFSAQDVKNLVLFGGMRPGIDYFQMDPGLGYGVLEFGRMVQLIEEHGFDRKQIHPHGGHVIGLHVAIGFDLGGCEAYPGVFQPFGGYPAGCAVGGGHVAPTSAPGFGIEEKLELQPHIKELLR